MIINGSLKLGGVTAIAPKDEYLGLSALPAKMTAEAMLLTACKGAAIHITNLAEETLRNDFCPNVCAATILVVTQTSLPESPLRMNVRKPRRHIMGF